MWLVSPTTRLATSSNAAFMPELVRPMISGSVNVRRTGCRDPEVGVGTLAMLVGGLAVGVAVGVAIGVTVAQEVPQPPGHVPAQ